MPKGDPAGNNQELLDQKLKQAADIINTTGSRVLPALLFTLAASWFLSLERQITPLFWEVNGLAKTATQYATQLEIVQTHRNDLEVGFPELRKQTARVQVIEDKIDHLINLPPNELRSEDLTALRNEKAKLRDTISTFYDSLSTLKAQRLTHLEKLRKTSAHLALQKEKAENVSFKLPIFDLQIPRLAAPTVWCLVALGTILFASLNRKKVHQLHAEAFAIATKLGIPNNNLAQFLSDKPWWLTPFPLRHNAVKWYRRTSLLLLAMLSILGVACLRMLCLGFHALAFEDNTTAAECFIFLTAASSSVVLYLIVDWLLAPIDGSSPRQGASHRNGRRLFLKSACAFGAATIASYWLCRRFRPVRIADVVKKLEELQPTPNHSPKFFCRPRRHIYNVKPRRDDEQPEAIDNNLNARSGVFVCNKGNTTIHFIFPQDAYAAITSVKRRKAKREIRSKNRSPWSDFVRWGKPPKVFGETVTTPEDLLKDFPRIDLSEVKKLPHVAFDCAPSAFEYAMLKTAVRKNDFPRAINLGMAGIRHDLGSRAFGKRPNFRIYDLTAGLIIHSNQSQLLEELVALIQESSRSALFTDRLAKWLNPNNKWSARWQSDKATVWANTLISNIF